MYIFTHIRFLCQVNLDKENIDLALKIVPYSVWTVKKFDKKTGYMVGKLMKSIFNGLSDSRNSLWKFQIINSIV